MCTSKKFDPQDPRKTDPKETWVSNSSSNLPRDPLVRSHSIFDETSENEWLEDVISYWNSPLFSGHSFIFRGGDLVYTNIVAFGHMLPSRNWTYPLFKALLSEWFSFSQGGQNKIIPLTSPLLLPPKGQGLRFCRETGVPPQKRALQNETGGGDPLTLSKTL